MAQTPPRRPGLTFYLGTHEASWLGRAAVPLFVARQRLAPRKTLPRAAAPWALDSGAFMQLHQHGQWTITARQYAAEVRRFRDEVGQLAWAAPMDWMCEPFILERTGLTIGDHQRRTVENYLELRTLAPDLPFRPVLQGWRPADYLRHADLYERYGVSLAAEPLIGVGSICRRQGGEGEWVIRSLAPLQLHGFGVKTTGLLKYGHRLASADSLAWSYDARRAAPLAACTHKNCANCLTYASWWRSRLLAALDAANGRGWQGDLFDLDEEWEQPA